MTGMKMHPCLDGLSEDGGGSELFPMMTKDIMQEEYF